MITKRAMPAPSPGPHRRVATPHHTVRTTLPTPWSTLGRRIDIADYENVGGVIGALRRQADSVLRELTKKYERGAVLDTLLQLVSIEQGGQLARRPLRVATLNPDQVEMVEALIYSRLLHMRDVEGERVVEVTHEALFRQWEPLLSTIDASRRSIEVRSEVERTARAWDDAGRDESYLALRHRTW